MISQVSLRNVRLFGDEDRVFQLKPLTVFCGSNSSGKSTILKIFPLLRQSQGIRESTAEESGKLRFKGAQVDLGNYLTLVADNEVSRNMHFGLRISYFTGEQFVKFLKFIKQNDPAQFQWNEGPERPIEIEINCLFEFAAESTETKGPTSTKAPNVISGNMLKSTFEIISKDEVLLSWSVENMDAKENGADSNPFTDEPFARLYKFILPTYFFERTGMAAQVLPQKSELPNQTTLICLLRGLLPVTLIAEPTPDPARPSTEGRGQFERWPIPKIMDWQYETFKAALLNIHYLAPLRSPGKRYYIADLDVVPGMDPTGEFLPYILRDKGDSIIANVHPSHLGKQRNDTLESALSNWLCYLRTGNFEGSEAKQKEFELAVSEILVGVKLKSPGPNTKKGPKHSLADSGFGYSQIVPVLVRGLLAPINGTLVVEQPELHLHPALQVRIADFLLAMASIGKQIILETHSEHVVNAFRVKAAEDTENRIHQLCKIYFLGTESDKPQVYDLSVQADGSLNEWPESFFGEALTLSGRLLRAQGKLKQKKV